jgi:hypothetical protein
MTEIDYNTQETWWLRAQVHKLRAELYDYATGDLNRIRGSVEDVANSIISMDRIVNILVRRERDKNPTAIQVPLTPIFTDPRTTNTDSEFNEGDSVQIKAVLRFASEKVKEADFRFETKEISEKTHKALIQDQLELVDFIMRNDGGSVERRRDIALYFLRHSK